MTLGEFNEKIEKLTNAVQRFERMNFNQNKYVFYLANGDIINFRIPNNSIAHLLGVNIDYLRLAGRFKPNMNTYDCLMDFLEDSFQYSSLCNHEVKMSYDQMFSKYIDQKLECFETNLRIRTDEVLFIIKYDNEKTYQVEKMPDVVDYYIVRKCKDNNYYVLGLVKSDINDRIYTPATSRKYDDEESFNEFVSRIAKKQELTYMHLLQVTNPINGYENKASLYVDNKITALSNVINYSKKFDATTGVASDFLFSINKSKTSYSNRVDDLNLIRFLSDSLKSGNVLDSGTISEIVANASINEEIKDLIDTCNNLICSHDSSNSGAIANYSEVCEENNKLKQELLEAKEKIKLLEQVKEEKEKLDMENQLYREQFNVIGNAYQKVLNFGENV